MTIGLLTLHVLSIAAIGITVFYGIHIPDGGGAFGRHFLYALAAACLAVFTHTMTYFYFVGMGSNLKRAVEEHGRGKDRLAESRKIKAKVLPWAFLGMGILMVTFILGGGAHTRAIPSWIHGGLGYFALGYSVVALLVEGYYLLQQNGLVNAFQRELLGAREPAD
jgi:Na+/H+ antiporter NhaC